MRIPLDQIEDEPFRWREIVDIAADSLDQREILRLDPVEWSGVATRVEAGFVLEARLRADLEVACDRCLTSVAHTVDESLSLLLLPQAHAPHAEELELEEQDFGVLHIPEREDLDTGPMMRELLDLGVPMKPLCRKDCAGLCPQCGANRNRGDCSCVAPPSDPRWADLQALKDQLGGD